jgi:drug/metabolite transporter (DMT)-like permease
MPSQFIVLIPTAFLGRRKACLMSRAFANLLLLAAAICWGTGNVAQQTVLEHIGPLMTTGLKSLIGAMVIMPYCLNADRERPPLESAGIAFGLVVILSFVAATTLMQIAYGLTTVTNAGFLVNIATVLTPIFAWLFLRQRPGNIIWFAAIATFFGAVLIGGGHIGALTSGDILSLGSAVCFAVWMVSLGEFVTRFGRVGLITIAQFGIAALICTPWGFAQEAPALAAIYAAAPELLYIGIVSTGGAYLLQAIAQRHTSSSEAAVIVSAEAVIGAFAAFLILGEHVSFERAIGAALIVVGIILVQIPTTRTRSQLDNAADLAALTPGK